MNTQELKEYIGRVLGNNIRCLLPSYWWKRLFGLVVDRVEEVEGKVYKEIPELITSSLAEFAKKYPDVESRTFYHTTNAESEGAQKNLALYEKVVAEVGNIVKPVYISYYMYSVFPTIVAQWGILGVEEGELIRFYNIPTAPQGRKYMVDMVLMADGTIEIRDNYFLAKGDLELDEYSDTPIANSTVSKEFYRSARAIRIANSDSFVLKDNAKIYYSIRNAEPYRPIVITNSSTTYLATYRESTGNEDGDPIRFIGITYNYSYGEYDLRYIQILLNADGTVTEENSGTLETNAEIPDISNLATKSELEAKYTKPSSGIPKSDLVSEVQESLEKADTAIQNVKTINGESILGEGNLTIQGGNGSYDDTEIRNELSRKADVDGVYPDMTVGMTRDMLGVGEGDEGEFLFRPTDGDGSIKDGFASIARIEGNSVVWNQGVNIQPLKEISAGVTFEVDNTGKVTITGQNDGTVSSVITFPQSINLPASHKFLFLAEGVADSAEWGKYGLRVDGLPYADYAYITNGRGVPFTVPNADTKVYLVYVIWSGQDHEDCSFYPCLYDLTRMFGAGNEPTTIEEFYQRIPKGIDINAYNEGEVVNMNVEGIKSVGFNLWDGDATIEDNSDAPNYAIGLDKKARETIRKIILLSHEGNIIHYTCDTEGQTQGQMIGAFVLYNKDYVPIGEILPNQGDSSVLAYYSAQDILNAEHAYFYGTGLSPWKVSNICIHLVHTGYRNGEYEPYVSDEIALPIADYFPNGMNSIGDVKDELTAAEAIQRIDVVDMGTLEWKEGYGDLLGNQTAYYVTLDDSSFNENNILTSRYSIIPVGSTTKGILKFTDRSLVVADPSYTDAASFKAAMQGVMLYYELAEPIVTTFDKPLDLDYQVWDFGTEEAIAEGKTTPLKASIIYEFNARDTIRANKLALKNKADKTYVNEAIAQAITNTLNTPV